MGLQAGAKVGIPGLKIGGKIDLGSLNFGWSNGNFYLTESQSISDTAKAGIGKFGVGGTLGYGRQGAALTSQTPNDSLSNQPWTPIADDLLSFSASGSLLGGFDLKAGISEGDVSQCMRDSGF